MNFNTIQGLLLLALASSTLSLGCADATMHASHPIDTSAADAADAALSDTRSLADVEDARDTGFEVEDAFASDSWFDAVNDLPSDANTESDATAGPDTRSEPDSSSGDAGTPPLTPFDCPDGSTVEDGWNTVQVGADERRYHIDLPADTTTPPAILFGFHGFTLVVPPVLDLLNFRSQMLGMGLHPNARADLPFILVLMQDVNRLPPGGLDWDLRTDEPNVDLRFFEALVGCLVDHKKADEERVFAFGFSAGATIANLIHSKYPEMLRAFVTESGLWANEVNNLRIGNQVTFGLPVINWQWPAMEPVSAGSSAVLLTRGGPGDLIPGSPVPASLDEAGGYARDALVANGRVVVDCWHNGGHTLHPGVSGAVMLDFFAAHTTAGSSPLLNDTIPSLPQSCTIVRP